MLEQGESYIGDGVYASFDGWQIKLRAPREQGDHVVFLDEDTFLGLLRFMRRWGHEPNWMTRGLRSISSKENR